MRFYCFTSFNVQQPPNFDSAKYEYLIYGEETCPDTGRKHLQGYLAFKNSQYLTFCQKEIPGAYFEPAKGTPDQNRDYCSKDGNFKEFGVLPKTGRGGGEFANAIKLAESGDIVSIKEQHPGLYLRYKKTLESIRIVSADELGDSCGVYLYGPPRAGKDFACLQKFKGDIYMKAQNKWWDGYAGEKNVLISDLDKFHAPFMGTHLKIWTDRYPFNAEIKGAVMKIRPEKIHVTSNFRLDELVVRGTSFICFTSTLSRVGV